MKGLSFKDSNRMECIVKEVDVSSSFYKDKEPRISVERLNPDIMAFSETKDILGHIKVVALEKPKVVGYNTEIDSQIILTQSKVKELLPILQHFAETGELSLESKEDLILYKDCDLVEKEEYTDCRNCYRYDICRDAKVKELIDE